MQDVLLFANPISGRGRGKALAASIQRRLRADGYRVQLHLEPPSKLRREDLPARPKAAVVVGGDGTLRTVADRLLALLDHIPPIVTVPMGTANLMGRYLQIPKLGADVTAPWVSHALRGGRETHVDAARADGKLFLLMVGVGFDAHVVHDLGRWRRGPIQMASYVIPTARALGSYRFVALRVIADGKEVFSSGPAVAFVGNASEYGIGFPVLPLARPDDQKLDVCVLPCRSRTQFLQWCLSVVAGEHLLTAGVVYLRATHVRIESARPIPIQIDGDPAGHTPVSIDLLPIRLTFMVPPEALNHG